MLFDPSRHEPLTNRLWDKAIVEAEISTIIDDIEQCQKARLVYGQGRYTLWTGDAGLAIYLYHCLHPKEAEIPGLDLF